MSLFWNIPDFSVYATLQHWILLSFSDVLLMFLEKKRSILFFRHNTKTVFVTWVERDQRHKMG